MVSARQNGTDRAAPQDATLRRMANASNYNDWLVARARPHLGRRVLDVGAGIGTFAELLAKLCERVVAVEPDPHFAAVLRERFASHSNVEVMELDVVELGRDGVEERFDSVVSLNVLEHIPDDAAALAACHNQLVPEGKLLLLVPSDPFLFGPLDRVLGHERRYRKDGLRRLLEEAGFGVEVLRHVNPIGAAGWLVSGRILGRELIPAVTLRAYDRAVPALRALDRVELPFGLSLWAVARKESVSA